MDFTSKDGYKVDSMSKMKSIKNVPTHVSERAIKMETQLDIFFVLWFNCNKNG